jgi:hypothetical protein
MAGGSSNTLVGSSPTAADVLVAKCSRAELEKLILHPKERSYQGHAEISDESYDQLENELKSLDPQNPVLHLVGFKQSEASSKVEHKKKMLSLESTALQASIATGVAQRPLCRFEVVQVAAPAAAAAATRAAPPPVTVVLDVAHNPQAIQLLFAKVRLQHFAL